MTKDQIIALQKQELLKAKATIIQLQAKIAELEARLTDEQPAPYGHVHIEHNTGDITIQ